MPLRAFLGVTFVYAGLQKLADRWFFTASAPASVQSQLRGAVRTSPIGALLSGPAHHAVLVGVLIAFAELAVGLGALLGLWARLAAAGGMLLSFSFLLAVSWHSRPYYYGADVVFLFAWTPLVIAGAGPLSLDAIAASRARTELGVPAEVPVTLGFATVQRLCGYYDAGRCTALRGRRCAPAGCPVLAPEVPARTAAELDRRTVLARAGWAGWLGASAVVGGGFVALLGRIVPPRGKRVATTSLTPGGNAASSAPVAPAPAAGGPATTAGTNAAATGQAGTAGTSGAGSAGGGTASATTGAQPGTSASAAPTTTSPPTTRAAAPAVAGTRIGPSAAVPVGGAASFTDPGSGDPAYVVQPARGRFVAFDATCTHQGCPVQYAGSQFQCPCHGAVFDATTGAVLQGPARRPLRAITIQAGPDGELYVQ